MGNGDQILRSYSILSSLKENIPKGHEISDTWVNEYHSALEKLELSIGIDLSEFKVPREQIVKSVSGGNYLTGEVTYALGLWCERSILIHKLNSVLTYFTGLQSGGEKKIGFHR